MGDKLARGVKGVNSFVKDFSQLFSQRLIELRGTQSKSAFGRFLGIPNPSTYHNYERGRVPDSQTVADIAQRCGVTVDWLLGRADPPSGIAGVPPAALPSVREDPCHYPGDIPARLEAMEGELATIRAQLETVTALLSGALRAGIENPIHKKAG